MNSRRSVDLLAEMLKPFLLMRGYAIFYGRYRALIGKDPALIEWCPVLGDALAMIRH
jgi:hypothetical protein